MFVASSRFIRPSARPPMAPYGNRGEEWMCPAPQQLLMRVRQTQSCIGRRLGERSPCVTTEASSSNTPCAHLCRASLYTYQSPNLIFSRISPVNCLVGADFVNIYTFSPTIVAYVRKSKNQSLQAAVCLSGDAKSP